MPNPNIMWLLIPPFISSAILFSLKRGSVEILRGFALLTSLIPLILLFIFGLSWIQSEVTQSWAPSLGIEFHLRVDSLSFLFVALTAIIVPISLFGQENEKIPYPHVFYGLVLLLEGLLIGFFLAQDLVVFAFFWEGMLIPLYFLISIWGGEDRKRAALKFLIYMVAGSFLMVAAILALYFAEAQGTFNLETLSKISENVPYSAWIAAIFFIAFAVKTPLFPFHAWLPDAYYEASTTGTILLSALLSKAGIYGFFRIGLELFPSFIKEWSPLFLAFSIFGVFYGGLSAWLQKDFKRLMAYSSFSHVNFILAAIFVVNQTAQSGAILQALNHGITIASLFLVLGWLQDRIGTTEMNRYSGLTKYLPLLSWFTLLFILSTIALPGTNNFVGEILILFGLFLERPYLAAFLTLSVVLSVLYTLRFMQKVYYETPSSRLPSWIDIGKEKVLVLLILTGLILWIGIYPLPVLKQIETAIKNYLPSPNQGALKT